MEERPRRAAPPRIDERPRVRDAERRVAREDEQEDSRQGPRVWAAAAWAVMAGWTALVHLAPPFFFGLAAAICAGWLLLSGLAMGPALRPWLALRPAGLALGLVHGGLLYLGSRVVLWLFCRDPSSALCDALAAVYARFGGGGALVAWELALLIAPAEELFWRGVVQGRLRPRLGRAGAVAATALLSGLALLLAGEPLLALAAVLTSLLWGALAEHQRALAPAIVSHALWDVLLVVLLPAAPRA